MVVCDVEDAAEETQVTGDCQQTCQVKHSQGDTGHWGLSTDMSGQTQPRRHRSLGTVNRHVTSNTAKETQVTGDCQQTCHIKHSQGDTGHWGLSTDMSGQTQPRRHRSLGTVNRHVTSNTAKETQVTGDCQQTCHIKHSQGDTGHWGLSTDMSGQTQPRRHRSLGTVNRHVTSNTAKETQVTGDCQQTCHVKHSQGDTGRWGLSSDTSHQTQPRRHRSLGTVNRQVTSNTARETQVTGDCQQTCHIKHSQGDTGHWGLSTDCQQTRQVKHSQGDTGHWGLSTDMSHQTQPRRHRSLGTVNRHVRSNTAKETQVTGDCQQTRQFKHSQGDTGHWGLSTDMSGQTQPRRHRSLGTVNRHVTSNTAKETQVTGDCQQTCHIKHSQGDTGHWGLSTDMSGQTQPRRHRSLGTVNRHVTSNTAKETQVTGDCQQTCHVKHSQGDTGRWGLSSDTSHQTQPRRHRSLGTVNRQVTSNTARETQVTGDCQQTCHIKHSQGDTGHWGLSTDCQQTRQVKHSQGDTGHWGLSTDMSHQTQPRRHRSLGTVNRHVRSNTAKETQVTGDCQQTRQFKHSQGDTGHWGLSTDTSGQTQPRRHRSLGTVNRLSTDTSGQTQPRRHRSLGTVNRHVTSNTAKETQVTGDCQQTCQVKHSQGDTGHWGLSTDTSVQTQPRRHRSLGTVNRHVRSNTAKETQVTGDCQQTCHIKHSQGDTGHWGLSTDMSHQTQPRRHRSLGTVNRHVRSNTAKETQVTGDCQQTCHIKHSQGDTGHWGLSTDMSCQTQPRRHRSLGTVIRHVTSNTAKETQVTGDCQQTGHIKHSQGDTGHWGLSTDMSHQTQPRRHRSLGTVNRLSTDTSGQTQPRRHRSLGTVNRHVTSNTAKETQVTGDCQQTCQVKHSQGDTGHWGLSTDTSVQTQPRRHRSLGTVNRHVRSNTAKETQVTGDCQQTSQFKHSQGDTGHWGLSTDTSGQTQPRRHRSLGTVNRHVTSNTAKETQVTGDCQQTRQFKHSQGDTGHWGLSTDTSGQTQPRRHRSLGTVNRQVSSNTAKETQVTGDCQQTRQTTSVINIYLSRKIFHVGKWT